MRNWQLFLLCMIHAGLSAQNNFEVFLTPSDTLNIPRRNAVIITEASLATVTLIGLDQLWYSDFERSSFRTIDDSSEWLQMDKLGHVFSAYQLGRIGANTLRWSGVRKNDQLLYGGTLGFSFLAAVELMDGFSSEWGFSWTDILANGVGTGLYIGQELLWEEQRISMKYSFHQTQFASQNPDKLGDGFLEEMLKDYNGQTYWLSANIHSFLNEESRFPKWLNLAFGYGAEGMLSAENDIVNNFSVIPDRSRQFYLSLDVDLTRIRTNSRVLKTLFDVFNVIKVPFPTLELDSRNGLKLHYIYF